MKVLVVVFAVLAVAAAQYALPYSGLGYSGYPHAAGYWNNFATPYSTYPGAPYTTYAAAPYTAYAAPAGVSSQHYSLSRRGDYSYGYADGLSTKTESKNAYGATLGSYSYVDPNGLTQTVNYVADSAGFRAQGTNLPVAPVADLKAPVNTLVGPAPVEDTADVKAARAEFRKLYAEAAAAVKAANASRGRRSAPLPVSDTPEVVAAKAEHARLYNAAALGIYPQSYAASSPRFTLQGTFGPEGASYAYSTMHSAFPYRRLFY
ncbi:cuticle protein 19.8-like [Pollicipes pollicipes]|uniref:cuticle protein 19.8-like n=1 Tax=Pollicipes pollicipes TaxID=41117 RepID=UPI001884A14C|nr:cuticle protein 19.8-like [Pollicipes pollicipes]